MQPTSIHDSVREHYAELARTSNSCCGSNSGNSTLYDEKLIQAVPADISGFSLGCGDPITLASLKPGETILDLGSGGGLDCFLAAKQVGEAGRVIGVDMTPDMLAKARANAERLGYPNVEFREGYLEALPVEDHSVDVVISNCVINLSPDKPQVFREVFRALKPGGRVAVSDIVTNGSLPEKMQKNMEAWGACVAGALDQREYVRGLREAGFVNVQVQPKSQTDRALAALPIGVPFSATVTAHTPFEIEQTPGGMSDEATTESTVTTLAQFDDLKQLIGDITDLNAIENGYDLRLQGDPKVIRARVEELRNAIGCCTPLNFDVVEAADGAHVRITNAAETAFVSLSDIN
ncbi:MAG: arsenite methyltransferase [Chloroflexi bacterium]|nr:arsenite methyltransferase [Chloroflexota bacterium]